MQLHILKTGDIVCFKKIYKIDLLDLINRQENYSKYMIILQVYNGVKDDKACKVLCANGEINWVAASKLEKIE